ncbi:MAG: hypothetical protein EXQ95_07605 [Alphaproteobacteria bacterium]|nr:hypothetical protein [Alphaproteobacteria bacterium]
MTPSLRRALLSTLPLVPLAACADNPVSRYFEWQKHAEVVEFAPEPLYCYRTLARSDCFAQPLDRRESNRIVSYYGSAPGRVVPAPPPPRDKVGAVVDHPPLMVPREKVESEPLPPTPRSQPLVPADSRTD